MEKLKKITFYLKNNLKRIRTNSEETNSLNRILIPIAIVVLIIFIYFRFNKKKNTTKINYLDTKAAIEYLENCKSFRCIQENLKKLPDQFGKDYLLYYEYKNFCLMCVNILDDIQCYEYCKQSKILKNNILYTKYVL